MTLAQLQQQVAGGENLHTEFKRKLPEWDKLMREVVAFANTDGGCVFIGVDDDGSLPGLKEPREVEEVLGGKINAYTRPAPEFTIERVAITPKRAVVVIRVAASLHKPHIVLEKPDATRGLATVRIADSSVTASREVFEMLKYEGRERNMKVEYGEKEAVLMRCLEEQPYVTVDDFARLAKIPRNTASRTLVHLCKANVLRLRPQVDGPDRYKRAID